MLNTLVTTNYSETHSTESYGEAMMNVCYPGSSHDALERLAKGSREQCTYRVGAVSFHEFIDGDIILVQFGACVVPPNYSFSG